MEEIKRQLRHNLYYINEIEQTYELCKYVVKKNGLLLEYIKEQTEELCILAVKNDCYAFRYVEERFQTDYICKLAIGQNYKNLLYVKNMTNEIKRYSVNCCGYAIQFIDKPDIEPKTMFHVELCNMAVCNTGRAITHIKDKSIETLKLSLLTSDYGIKYIDESNIDLCNYKEFLYGLDWFKCNDINKIKLNILCRRYNIIYIPEQYQTPEIYTLLLSYNKININDIPKELNIKFIDDYMKNSTEENYKVYELYQKIIDDIDEIALTYLKYNTNVKKMLKYNYNLRFPLNNFFKKCIDLNVKNYEYIRYINEELAKYIISKDKSLIGSMSIMCKNKSKDFSLFLVSQYLDAIKYIDEQYIEHALELISNSNFNINYSYDLFNTLNKYYDKYDKYINIIYTNACIKKYENIIFVNEKFIESGLKIISENVYDITIFYLCNQTMTFLNKYYTKYTNYIKIIYDNICKNNCNLISLCNELYIDHGLIIISNNNYKYYSSNYIEYKNNILTHILNNIDKFKNYKHVIEHINNINNKESHEIIKYILEQYCNNNIVETINYINQLNELKQNEFSTEIQDIFEYVLNNNVNILFDFNDYNLNKKQHLQYFLNNIDKITNLEMIRIYLYKLKVENHDCINQMIEYVLNKDKSYIKKLYFYIKKENINKYINTIIEKDYIECPICNDLEKDYFFQYKCHKNHIVCFECMIKNSNCYYRCNNGTINFDVLYIKKN